LKIKNLITGTLLLISGCHQEDETSSALRKSVGEALQGTKSLEVQRIRFPSDGGSIMFGFQMDSGKELVVTVLHPKAVRKPSSHQIIKLSDSWKDYGFELYPNSLLEEDLCRLVEKCQIRPGIDPEQHYQPTRERCNWLLSRIKDRSRGWEYAP